MATLLLWLLILSDEDFAEDLRHQAQVRPIGVCSTGYPVVWVTDGVRQWASYKDDQNPFTLPVGNSSTCQFPQISSGGLDDSYQHGSVSLVLAYQVVSRAD